MSAEINVNELINSLVEIPGRLAALEKQVASLATKGEPDEPPERFLTVMEAAEILGVSVPTIRRWISTGKIKAIKIENSVRISSAWLQKVSGYAQEKNT